MAAEIETDEGVVFKGEPEIDDAILLKDSKGQPWQHYLKYGKNYDSYKPAVGQKVRVHYRPWENPTTGKVAYYLNKVEILGPPPEDAAPVGTAPGQAPVYSVAGPAPVTYQETHDAAQARVAPDGSSDFGQEPSDGAADVAALLEPKPGDYAFRDLSIMRQNRLNVTVQALIANLEQCPPDEKVGRMITPWKIAEFERLLVEGAADEGGSEPPPEDLPG